MSNSGVIFTNDDATSCKRYAVHKKYWNDNFIQYFVKSIPEKKAPEINRGYYIRHKCIRKIIEQFLDITQRDCQIVILGAGFETLYWNLYEADNYPKFGIFEIDLPQVVQRKCFNISSKSQLKTCLIGDTTINKDSVSSDFYKLFPADISKIDSIDNMLSNNDIDKNKPTLFLAECVMVYLKFEHSEKLMDYISRNYSTVVYVEYDPISLNDRFGEVMKDNLRRRQSDLLGAHPDIHTKKIYFSSYFSHVDSQLLFDVYQHIQQKRELETMEKLEFLDEVELLTDLLKHYAISICSNDTMKINLSLIKL